MRSSNVRTTYSAGCSCDAGAVTEWAAKGTWKLPEPNALPPPQREHLAFCPHLQLLFHNLYTSSSLLQLLYKLAMATQRESNAG